MEPVTIYSTGPQCGKCRMTKLMMDGKNIPWREIDITQDPVARDYVTEELGYSVAPVVVVNDQDHWSDLRPDHIERIAKHMAAHVAETPPPAVAAPVSSPVSSYATPSRVTAASASTSPHAATYAAAAQRRQDSNRRAASIHRGLGRA